MRGVILKLFDVQNIYIEYPFYIWLFYLKGRWPRFQTRAATNIFSDYCRSSSSKPTPFHLDWHQYAHILHKFSRVGRKTTHCSEASHLLAFQEVFTGNPCFSEIQASRHLTSLCHIFRDPGFCTLQHLYPTAGIGWFIFLGQHLHLINAPWSLVPSFVLF